MVAQIDSAIPTTRQINLPERVTHSFESELSTFITRRFEWGVVLWMCGIALYFALPFEPDWRLLGFVGFALFVVARFVTKQTIISVSLVSACLLTLGIARSAWHTADVNALILPDYERSYTVKGWVKHVEKSGNRTRWVLSVGEMDGLSPQDRPAYVRMRVSAGQFTAGDFVTVRARLSAPPDPVVPNGYDSARAAFFKQIGGYGFAVANPEAAPAYEVPWPESLQRKISQFRYGLADRILAAAPERTAGLQVALLTGIRLYIPEQQTEALRMSGLAHVLAISGLHMGLVSGTLYFVFTFLLALIIPLSRRIDVRKPAALIGINSATAYLVLSGASVATQRAFIMTVIVFMAVILDRRAFSLRSVALAAVVTLMLHPEALVSAGFQMSFAAVTALVVVYRIWDRHRDPVYPRSILSKFGYGFSSLSVTSLVAGSATGFFAIYHFKRMATFGLAGNLLAMPIFTFWVMPVALIVYAAMPLGLEAAPLQVMGWGLEVILWLANTVASWPGAVQYYHQAGPWVMPLFVAGFLIMCLSHVAGRVVGTIVMGVSLLLWMQTPQPDMRISNHPAVTIQDGSDELWVFPKRRDSFGRDVFAESLGQPFATFTPLEDHSAARCDSYGCVIRQSGYVVSVLERPDGLDEACADSDIVVMTERPAGMSIRRRCQAMLFDSINLSDSGSVHLYLGGKTIRISSSNSTKRRSRPWNGT